MHAITLDGYNLDRSRDASAEMDRSIKAAMDEYQASMTRVTESPADTGVGVGRAINSKRRTGRARR